jgi:hypothetical protein
MQDAAASLTDMKRDWDAAHSGLTTCRVACGNSTATIYVCCLQAHHTAVPGIKFRLYHSCLVCLFCRMHSPHSSLPCRRADKKMGAGRCVVPAVLPGACVSTR